VIAAISREANTTKKIMAIKILVRKENLLISIGAFWVKIVISLKAEACYYKDLDKVNRNSTPPSFLFPAVISPPCN